jgi:predicted enzyme related to lactoylglutathione lyase
MTSMSDAIAIPSAERSFQVAAVGTIAWHELAAADPSVAIDFYGCVFGWQAERKEFEPGVEYVTWSLGGFPVAGMLPLSALRAGGQRSRWLPVVRTPNVDIVAARASELHGSLLAEPAGIQGLSRHATVADPTGAGFGLLCALDGEAMRGPGCVGWTELRTVDPVQAAIFYWQVFGWQAVAAGSLRDHPCTAFTYAGSRMASLARIEPRRERVSRWLPCIEISDLEHTLAAATAAGGQVVEPPASHPILGETAVIDDPQGGEFQVFRRG